MIFRPSLRILHLPRKHEIPTTKNRSRQSLEKHPSLTETMTSPEGLKGRRPFKTILRETSIVNWNCAAKRMFKTSNARRSNK